MELMLAHARCCDAARAAEIAARLEETVRPDAELLVLLGRAYALCAAAAGDAVDQDCYKARALRVLRAALDLGYRDADALRNSPDLAALRSTPGLAELLARLARPAAP
jgi:hypothetical protein